MDENETDVTDVAESGSDIDPIKAAGEKYLASLPPEARNKEFAQGVEDEVKDKEARQADEDEEENPYLETDERDEEGEEGEEQEEQPEKTESTVDEETPAESGKVITVKLPGQKERGEKPLELDIPADDQEVADRIKRLIKDGMRKSEHDKFVKERDQWNEEKADVEDRLEHDPANFFIEMVPPEKRLEVLKALLAEHYDDEKVQEMVSELADETSRREARVERKEKKVENEKLVAKNRADRQYRTDVFRAVTALIPEGADEADVKRFYRDAEADLMDEMTARKARIPVSEIKEVLDYRIKMYGFERRTPVRGDGKARPGSDKARDIAERSQDRRKNVAVRRKGAAAAGSPGAGAISSRPPKVAKGQTIEEASAATLARIRKEGGGDSWQRTG